MSNIEYEVEGTQYILIDHQDNRFSLKIKGSNYLLSHQVLQRVMCQGKLDSHDSNKNIYLQDADENRELCLEGSDSSKGYDILTYQDVYSLTIGDLLEGEGGDEISL